MPKPAASQAANAPLQQLARVADLLSSARSPAVALQRTLQWAAEAAAARSGTIVLTASVPKVSSVCSWGEWQQQMVQMARGLCDGMNHQTSATAHHTVLPGVAKEQAPSGVLVSVPIRGMQQVLGGLVLFCAERPDDAVQPILLMVQTVSTGLGLYLQSVGLQERVKALEGTRQAVSSGTGQYDPTRIIGDSTPMKAVLQQVEQAASSRSTVLVRGESGTGIELIARALHRFSPRREQSFVQLNCAALPESLLESELFGHERGAFTGAVKMRRGRFELAHQGTLFLDEIGELSAATQVKLLRVLQERTFERVGGSRSIAVDVRIIAATNADLEEAVRLRRFREDLYYRLHVVPITLPPLRQRQEDIPLLVGHFLQRFNAENRKRLKISSAAMDVIVAYEWPGNVRELENCIERMVVMARSDVIAPEDVPLRTNPYAPSVTPQALPPVAHESSLTRTVADLERERLIEALRRCGGVQTRAAELLGITPRQFGYKMRKYRIDPKGVIR